MLVETRGVNWHTANEQLCLKNIYWCGTCKVITQVFVSINQISVERRDDYQKNQLKAKAHVILHIVVPFPKLV